MKTNERKYLEISTAHLKQKTLEGLNAMEPPYTYECEEGIFMSVPDKNETNISDMPKDLRILLQYAWINGIDLIRMDRDADVIDDIPVYDWEKKRMTKKLAKEFAHVCQMYMMMKNIEIKHFKVLYWHSNIMIWKN